MLEARRDMVSVSGRHEDPPANPSPNPALRLSCIVLHARFPDYVPRKLPHRPQKNRRHDIGREFARAHTQIEAILGAGTHLKPRGMCSAIVAPRCGVIIERD
jgi:hypothetical protein